MNKNKVRDANCSIPGLIVINILGIIGMIIFASSGILEARDLNEFREIISDKGFEIIMALLFMITCLYCWFLFFINIVKRPKKEVVYLSRINNNLYFITKKSKNIPCEYSDLVEDSYYYVLKTRNCVFRVLGQCNDESTNWKPQKKASYWFNCYTPRENVEDTLLLPVIYVSLLPGILSILLSSGHQVMYGILYSSVPVYLIIYDFIYKMELKKSNGNPINEEYFQISYLLFKGTVLAFALMIIYIDFIK